MAANPVVLQTKLLPPRPRRPALVRPRVSERILCCLDHRLTIVQAPTGYGKSTALVQALADGRVPLFWYSTSETDADPVAFLLHVIHALRLQLPDVADNALAFLRQGPSAGPRSWRRATDVLINEVAESPLTHSVLVIDDFHLVHDSPEIAKMLTQMVDHFPDSLSVVLSTRQRPVLDRLSRWEVKGNLAQISAAELAFSPEEIETLFRTQLGCRLTPGEVQRLWDETEGWIIALQMIWKAVESGAAGSVSEVCDILPEALDPLFDYLGKEVVNRLSPERQRFLLTTSVLRSLTPDICDAMLDWQGSETVLRALCDDGLFVQHAGAKEYRYQHLFQDFLREQLASRGMSRSDLHSDAARIYTSRGLAEEAIYHHLAAGNPTEAAEQIQGLADGMVRAGRLHTLETWIGALPHAVLEEYPALLLWMGDTLRLTSRFDDALEWYTRAENRYRDQGDSAGLSRALRAQGMVYLDTVRPLRAEALLEEALRLGDEKDRRDRAVLLELLAENRTNQGRLDEAKALRQQAREWLASDGPSTADLDVRVLLRTGQIAEAQGILEQRAAEEGAAAAPRPARAHRETLLLLSLIYAFQGNPEDARRCAREGIQIGRALGSPFVEAVGYMRLGHALQIGRPQPEEAEACYRKAISLAESLEVARAKVEPLWGLCRLYGYQGDLERAEACARDGISIGLGAGDEWIAALIRLALGAAFVLAGRIPEAVEQLSGAEAAFLSCSDSFARAASRLWLSLAYQKSGDLAALSLNTHEFLQLVREKDCAFLLTKPSFLGPSDPQQCVPLLMFARRQASLRAYASATLERQGLAEFDSHPGYSLTVQTLGPLRVWRGREEISSRDWQREKGRQVFALLLAHRGHFLQREQILDWLWRDADPTSAEAGFKVALNALNHALEPSRAARSSGFFVLRHESAYGLNPAASIGVDVDEFRALLTRADGRSVEPQEMIRLLREALDLYRGDYLADFLYEDWALRERDRLRQEYLGAATRLASHLVDAGDSAEAAQWCQKALAVDNCWEEAYRVLMRCHDFNGNQAMVIRTYERCERMLRTELDASPMPETVQLYRQLTAEEG